MDASSFLTPIIVTLVLTLLMAMRKPQAAAVEGRTTIAYGGAFKALATFFGILMVAPLVGLFFVAPADRIAMLAITAMFGVVSIPLMLEGYRVRIVLTDAGIESYSPWRRDRVVRWKDVRRVSFSHMAQWWRIETTQGYIRVHVYKSGIDTMLAELKARGIEVVGA